MTLIILLPFDLRNLREINYIYRLIDKTPLYYISKCHKRTSRKKFSEERRKVV